MNKEKIEKYLKEHQFDYEWNDKEHYLKIHKLGINWLVGYYELEYNILIELNINEFFKIVTQNPGSKVLLFKEDGLYCMS